MHRPPGGTLVPPSDPPALGRDMQCHGVTELGFCDPAQLFMCSVALSDTFLIVPVQFPGGFSNPIAGIIPLDLKMTRTPQSSCPVDPWCALG